MENENISPEERLFKAIKDGESNVSSDVSKILEDKEEKFSGSGPLPKPKPSFGIGGFLKKAKGSFKNILKNKNPSEKKTSLFKGRLSVQFDKLLVNPQDIDIRIVNRVLGIILALVLSIVFYFSYHGRKSIKDVTNEVLNINYQISVELVEPFKTASFYLDEINKRNIFNPYQEEAREEVVNNPDKGSKDKLIKISKDLKVIGISWGNDPRVMINKKGENKVFFLKKGQKIGGTNAAVTSIERNRVKIGYDGEEVELK